MNESPQKILQQHTAILLRHAAEIYALRSVLCDIAKAGGGDPAVFDLMIREKADKIHQKFLLEVGDKMPELAEAIDLCGLISRLDKEP